MIIAFYGRTKTFNKRMIENFFERRTTDNRDFKTGTAKCVGTSKLTSRVESRNSMEREKVSTQLDV